jgi:hypothetical protein
MYPNKQYFYCSYHEKDICKSLGAKWDFIQKQWYIPAGVDNTKFSKWLEKNDTEYE